VAQPADPVFRSHVGVHLILTEHGKVLLLQRANTGFADGSWSLPGGSLDEGETLPAGAAREAREELGILIDPADLAFAHLCHHADPDGQARIGVFFTAARWTGQPANTEPGKCTKIDWFDPAGLPADIVTYIRDGLSAHRHGQNFSLNGWPPGNSPQHQS
jgi:8-oxo-dGTP diphosphatase